MSRRFPKEFHEFMREFIPGHTDKEISEEIKKRFPFELTAEQVKSYKNNHGLRSGTPRGRAADQPTKRFPKEIYEFILDNLAGNGPKEMCDLVNAQFGTAYTRAQIKGFYGNRHLNSGVDGRYKTGHVPQNKGMKLDHITDAMRNAFFKPGNTPHNKLPIGTVVVKGDGYLWRKIGEGTREWKQEHVLRWEEVNGPVPDGCKLLFLDGDKMNVDVSNLRLINSSVLLEMNRKHLRSSDPELTKLGITVAELNTAIINREKKRHENEHNK